MFRVGLRWAGDDPRIALRQRPPTEAELAEIRARLDRLDAASSTGPWTRRTLAIIDRSPEVRAPDLAAELGRDTASFKRDVRKLKELGLTESLDIGYRLSPRGEAVVDDGGPPRDDPRHRPVPGCRRSVLRPRGRSPPPDSRRSRRWPRSRSRTSRPCTASVRSL